MDTNVDAITPKEEDTINVIQVDTNVDVFNHTEYTTSLTRPNVSLGVINLTQEQYTFLVKCGYVATENGIQNHASVSRETILTEVNNIRNTESIHNEGHQDSFQGPRTSKLFSRTRSAT
ncbi:hypothetical protein [Mudlarkpox virus]|nr:hypothetical protein [Mudlarkpox virus]